MDPLLHGAGAGGGHPPPASAAGSTAATTTTFGDGGSSYGYGGSSGYGGAGGVGGVGAYGGGVGGARWTSASSTHTVTHATYGSASTAAPPYTERRVYLHTESPRVSTVWPHGAIAPIPGTVADGVATATRLLAAAVGRQAALDAALASRKYTGAHGPLYTYTPGPQGMPVSTFTDFLPRLPVPAVGLDGHGDPPPPPPTPATAAAVAHAAAPVYNHWLGGAVGADAQAELFAMAAWSAGLPLSVADARAECRHGLSLGRFQDWWVQQWCDRWNLPRF